MSTSRRIALPLSVLLLAAGCGGDDDDDDDDHGSNGDDGTQVDAAAADPDAATSSPDASDGEVDAAARGCLLSAGCPDWIEDYQREVISALTGETSIGQGVVLSQRASVAERVLVRAYISSELARWGLEPQTHEYSTGANVYAELPATTDGDGIIILGGHFDSVPGTPGAADDGTGVALVLAAARYLSEVEPRNFTVVFAAFDEEEVGLLGSQAFAEKTRFDARPVLGMHNFDMVSWDEDGDRGVELWSPAPDLERFYRAAAGDLGLPIEAYDFLPSDHASFIGEGFDAVGMGEEYHQGDSTPFYHQAGDNYDSINFGFLASATQLALLVVERQLGAE
jgi:hypothetical protein